MFLVAISIFVVFCVNDELDIPKPIIMLVGLVCIVSFGTFVKDITKDINYKRGQIDALTGVVKYELVSKPDSTKVWEKIVK